MWRITCPSQEINHEKKGKKIFCFLLMKPINIFFIFVIVFVFFKLLKIRTRNIQERKTSHRSQMEADSTWYVYKYLGPANCSTAFIFGLILTKKKNEAAVFGGRNFVKSEMETKSNQTGQPIELVNQRSWIVSNCGVVLNLNISIANGLPSSSSSKGFLYLPPEYTGIQQLDFYWPLASNVCKTLSHLMFHFLRTKERTKWKRNEIGTADRGI